MEKEASMRSNSQSGLILVVDDEEKHRRLLRDMLEANGYRVEVAKDGKAALERVKEAPPDVILLDVIMPGVDGFEVCRQLKKTQETALIPVLLVTSLSEREDRIAGIKAGANDFLTKPVNLREVMLRVKNALYAKRLFDQVQQNLKRLKELEALRDSLIQMGSLVASERVHYDLCGRSVPVACDSELIKMNHH